jgi:hypothetical protein
MDGARLVDQLLHLSDQFDGSLWGTLDVPLFDRSTRVRVGASLCSLSLTHGTSVRTLVREGLPESATVVLRAQYETVLRAVWALYAASDIHVARLSSELASKGQEVAVGLPQPKDMLEALPGKAPDLACRLLETFRHTTLPMLNPFARTGVHAVRRHGPGYPVELVGALVRHSNGLSLIGAMQAAVLTGDQTVVQRVGQHQAEFAECLPA